MNRVELVGGVIRDPEIKMFDNGGSVTRFTVGIKDARYDPSANGGTGGDVVVSSYISCVFFGQPGEEFADQFQKGDQIYVFGELTQEEVPAAGGKKESKTRVRVLWVRGVRRPNRSTQTGVVGSNEPPF